MASWAHVLGVAHMARSLAAVLVLLACSAAGARTVRVAGNDGAPVAGARAWVTLTGVVRELPVDESGRFELPDAGVDAACAMAPGHRPVAIPAEGEAVTLVRGEALQGSVLAAVTGAPVPGAIVRLSGDEILGPCARTAVTDAAGRWALGGLPRGTVAVEIVEAAGCLLPPPAHAVTGAGRRLDVRLHRACAITLAVSGPDGKPVAGAPVRILARWPAVPLEPPPWPALRKSIDDWRGTTAADGSVTLPPLPWRAGWRLVAEPAALAPASVIVDAKQPRQEAKLVLGAGATIVAQAVDEIGAPVLGAVARVVGIDGADFDLAPASQPSVAGGVVRLSRVPPGRLAVAISAPGMRPTTTPGVQSRHGATMEIGDVVLRPGAALTGTVRSARGPVDGAALDVRGAGDDGEIRASLTTDATGAFRLDALDPEARLKLRITAPRFVTTTVDRVRPSEGALEVELEPASTLVVEVRSTVTLGPVTDAVISLKRDGRAVSSRANATDHEAVSEEGTYVFPALRPGAYEISVRSPGHARAVRKATLSANEETRLEVALDAGRSVQGVVIEHGTETPVPGATISAPTLGSSATSGLDGTFVLDGFDTPASVSVDHPRYAALALPPVDPDALPVAGLVVTLHRGAAVEGTVFGRDGSPLAGAVVQAEGQAGRQATTDASGTYRLDGLDPGPQMLVKLEARGRPDGREAARVDLALGVVTRVDFGKGGRIHGRVTRGGEPLPEVQLGLMKVPDPKGPGDFLVPSAVATTDAEGRYELTGVVEGLHVLQLSWGQRQVSRDVIMPPATRDLPLDVELPDLHVAGIVVDAETKEPVPDIFVQMMPPPSGERSQMSMSTGVQSSDGTEHEISLTTILGARDMTGRDGRFRLPALQPGQYSLMALAQRRNAQVDLDLTASRDDIVLELPPAESRGDHELKVRLFDARTGASLEGTITCAGKRTSMSGGGQSEATARISADELPMTVGGWSPGYAVSVTEVTAESAGDEDVALDLRLSEGGALRLRLPEGVLPDALRCMPEPQLSIRLSSGFDLVRANGMVCMNIVNGMAKQEGEREAIIRDLPAGPVTVTYGAGAPHVVDIVPGETAELDLP